MRRGDDQRTANKRDLFLHGNLESVKAIKKSFQETVMGDNVALLKLEMFCKEKEGGALRMEFF